MMEPETFLSSKPLVQQVLLLPETPTPGKRIF